MKKPPRRRSAEEGWLRVTLLLSLVGLRLDWDGLSLPPHEKDHHRHQPFSWLREVRALGTPRFPATRLDAWLVQAGGEAVPQTAQPTTSSGEQHLAGASGGGDGSRAEEAAPEPPFSAGEQIRLLRPSGHEEREAGAAAASGESSQVGGEQQGADFKCMEYCHLPEEDKHSESHVEKEAKDCEKGDPDDWKESENTDQCSLNHRSTIDSSLFLEGYFPLLTSLAENTLEELVLGNILPVSSSGSASFHNTVNFTQAISHNVSLHDAMMVGSNATSENKQRRNLQLQETFPLNTSLIYSEASSTNDTNLLGIFVSDNSCRNLTNHDFSLGFDTNAFEEVNLTSLAIEEDFDPVEVSYLFEELDSDSGLSLNHSNSVSSFVLTCDSDAESATSDVLGAVGGRCLEYSKCCQMDYPSDFDHSAELLEVFHNHTYSLIPRQLTSPTSEHSLAWSEKSHKCRHRNVNTIDSHQSRDEHRAKALRIPFSVNDIVTLPVDSFNNMLSKYHLTDNQLSLIHDIRRRGKNKVAAQNCRKRKLVAITDLEEEVSHLQAQKESLKNENTQCSRSINLLKQKLNYLYWDTFSRLRDDQGRPINPTQYTLQCCRNGSILVVPGKAIEVESKQDNSNNKNECG